MPVHPSQEKPLKKLMKVVNDFINRVDSAPFREPVDWRGLGLDDYPEMIDTMMDLGTVKRKLERKQYYSAHQCAKDIKLIWSNCMTYNADGSDFWLLAKSFARRFDDRYRNIRKEFDCGQDLPPPNEDGTFPEYDTTIHEHSSSRAGSKANSRAPSRTASRASSPTHHSSVKGGASSKGSLHDGDDMDSVRSDQLSDDDDDEEASHSSMDASDQEMAGVTHTPPKRYTLDTKARFGANLFLLSGVELAHVITTLEQQCPEALEHLVDDDSPSDNNDKSTEDGNGEDNTSNNDSAKKTNPFVTPFQPATAKLEINVDNIEPELLTELVAYVSEKVGSKVMELDESRAGRPPAKKKRKS